MWIQLTLQVLFLKCEQKHSDVQKSNICFNLLTGTEQTSAGAEEDHSAPSETPSNKLTEGLLKHASQLKELLAAVPSVQELLSKAAENLLHEEEREVAGHSIFYGTTCKVSPLFYCNFSEALTV